MNSGRKGSADKGSIVEGERPFRVLKQRYRKVKSCIACHQRKVRCSQALPACSNCERRNAPCRYYSDDINVIISPPSSSEGPSRQNNGGVEFSESSLLPLQSVHEAAWPYSGSSPVSCRPAATMTSLLSRVSVVENHEARDTGLEDSSRLSNYLPEKSVADKLLERYFCTVHPVIPIYDWTQFLSDYEVFWKMPGDSSVSFLLQLFSVCHAASVSAYEEAKVTQAADTAGEILISLAKQATTFITGAELALTMIHFPRKPTFIGCQSALLLYAVCRSDCRSDDSAGLAALIRSAQLMGLHRDPSTVFEDKERQLRRMLWWQILYIDVMTALSNGLPPLIQAGQYDTLVPDEYIHASARLSPYVVFCNGRFLWAALTADILHQIHAVPKRSMAPEKFVLLNEAIKGLGMSLNSRVIRLVEANDNQAYSLFINWAVSMLSTLETRAQILLYREAHKEGVVDTGDAAGLPGTPFSLQSGLSASEKAEIPSTSSLADTKPVVVMPGLAQPALTFLNQFCRYGDKDVYSILVWEIRKFQPLQAILIVLHELSNEVTAQLENTGSMALDMKQNPKVRCINTCFEKLHYMGEQTTPLCVERWQEVTEIKDSLWQQLMLVDQFRQLYEVRGDMTFLGEFNATEIKNTTIHYRAMIEDSLDLQIWDPVAGHYVW
jgi:hypothetical protein